MKRRTKKAIPQTCDQPQDNKTPQRPRPPTHQQIQMRAHEIYLTRGAAPGHELDDWLLAEVELKSEMGLKNGSDAE